jgi:chaperonin cofactor prefoldin
MEETLKLILEELKKQTEILETTSKTTDYQMRRMATRLEELKL